jgi:hypothetical protein
MSHEMEEANRLFRVRVGEKITSLESKIKQHALLIDSLQTVYCDFAKHAGCDHHGLEDMSHVHPAKERICTECKHSICDDPLGKSVDSFMCKRHKNLVSGRYIHCVTARSFVEDLPHSEDADDCGPEGEFWTPKAGAE